MTDRPFKRLTVETHFHVVYEQRVRVSWALHERFTAPGPYVFTLQRALSPSETVWEDIAQCTDQPWIFDRYPLSITLAVPVFYRVRLVDGRNNEYISQAVTFETYWNRYDWSVAKEIVRKEAMVLRKRTGVKGWLLKRRTWGDPCPDCLDPVTLQSKDSNCQTCFGTSYAGGYFAPIEYWVAMNPSKRMTRLTQDRGIISANMETVRALAYPEPAQGDIWVHAATNQRFMIQQDVSAIARLRGVDLVVDIPLERLPTTHVIYNFPTPC